MANRLNTGVYGVRSKADGVGRKGSIGIENQGSDALKPK